MKIDYLVVLSLCACVLAGCGDSSDDPAPNGRIIDDPTGLVDLDNLPPPPTRGSTSNGRILPNLDDDPGLGPDAGDPVDIIRGSTKVSEVDIYIQCPDIDIVFQRVYNNAIKTSSGLGYGWVHSYDWKLKPSENGDSMILSALADPSAGLYGGVNHSFGCLNDGSYTVSDSDSYVLTKNEAGAYSVRMPGYTTYHFGPDGVMESISNISGNSVTLIYENRDDQNLRRLVKVQHTNGKSIEFLYEGDSCLIKSIRTPKAGYFLNYGYTNVVHDTLAYVRSKYGLLDSIVSYTYSNGKRSQGLSGFSDVDDKLPGVPSCDTLGPVAGISQFLNSASEGELIEKTDANGIRTRFVNKKYTDAVGSRTVYTTMDGGLYETFLDYMPGKTVVTTPVSGEMIVSEFLYDNYGRNYETKRGGDVHRMVFGEYGDMSCTIESNISSTAFIQKNTKFGTYHNVTNYGLGYCSAPVDFWSYTWDVGLLMPIKSVSPEGRILQGNIWAGGIMVYQGDSFAPINTLKFYCATNWRVDSIENANGHVTTFEYNTSGYIAKVEKRGRPSVWYEHDELGNTSKITKPGPNGVFRNTIFVNNINGGRMCITNADSTVQRYEYDAAGTHVVQSVDQMGRTNVFEWMLDMPILVGRTSASHPDGIQLFSVKHNSNMDVVSISDPLGRVAENYALDDSGRIVAVSNIDGRVMSYKYAVGDYISRTTRFDGTEVNYEYGINGKLRKIRYPDDVYLFDYDRDGLMLSASNSVGVVRNEYNEASWLSSTCGVDGSEVAYAYHPAGQVSNVASVAGTTSFSLDKADRLLHITTETESYAYVYNPWNSFVASVTNGSGIAAEYQYDIMDQVTNIVWTKSDGTVLAGFGYGYNAVGMIKDRITSLGTNSVAIAYAYDGLDRLVSETESSGVSRTYTYDLAGNRLSKTETGSGAIAYALGVGDRLATYTGGSYSYDTAGCVATIDRTGKPDLDLTWNGQYQLTSVSTNGVVAESYTYDPFGRRFSTTSGGTTIRHVYDGIHCVADIDSVGSVVNSYTWGLGVDNLLAVTCHSGTLATTYYALTDLQGTVHGFADVGGNLVARYAYDAWGNLLDADVAESDLVANRFLFQGREYSWATGIYNFRLRWYDPATGRWLSKDPTGISGGMNHYVFCMNDPSSRRDPIGAASKSANEKNENRVRQFAQDAINILTSKWLTKEGKSYRLSELLQQYADIDNAIDLLTICISIKMVSMILKNGVILA